MYSIPIFVFATVEERVDCGETTEDVEMIPPNHGRRAEIEFPLPLVFVEEV